MSHYWIAANMASTPTFPPPTHTALSIFSELGGKVEMFEIKGNLCNVTGSIVVCGARDRLRSHLHPLLSFVSCPHLWPDAGGPWLAEGLRLHVDWHQVCRLLTPVLKLGKDLSCWTFPTAEKKKESDPSSPLPNSFPECHARPIHTVLSWRRASRSGGGSWKGGTSREEGCKLVGGWWNGG